MHAWIGDHIRRADGGGPGGFGLGDPAPCSARGLVSPRAFGRGWSTIGPLPVAGNRQLGLCGADGKKRPRLGWHGHFHLVTRVDGRVLADGGISQTASETMVARSCSTCGWPGEVTGVFTAIRRAETQCRRQQSVQRTGRGRLRDRHVVIGAGTIQPGLIVSGNRLRTNEGLTACTRMFAALYCASNMVNSININVNI
jgi:hypothetical protein